MKLRPSWSPSAVFVLLLLTNGERRVKAMERCDSKQYVELGKEGTIQCSFEEGFYGVYWYNSADVTQNPILYYEQLTKSGKGFEAGEFDVATDGSLVIRNVSLQHEHEFTVAVLPQKMDTAISITIDLVVVVQPVPRHPVIEGCSHLHYCVLTTESEGKLTCRLTGIRPVIQLMWRVLNPNVAGNFSFFNEKSSITQKGEVYDIFLTAYFRVNDNSKSKLTVECVGYGLHSDMFGLSTKIDLKFETGGEEIVPSSNAVQSKTPTVTISITWLMVVATLILSLSLLSLGMLGKLLLKKENSNSSLQVSEALLVDYSNRSGGKVASAIQNILMELILGQEKKLQKSFYTRRSYREDSSLTTLEETNEDQTLLSQDEFSKLQECIGINKIGESGLVDFFDVTDILRDQPIGKSAALLFFQRLLSNDNSATTVFTEAFQDEVSQVNLKNDEQLLSTVHGPFKSSTLKTTERNFSCRDALFVIYHSCKLPLRHSVLSKMSELRLAVPLLLPDPFKRDEVALLLSDLRNVHKVWTEKGQNKSASVSDYPFPTVATMRIGHISVSKGRILNMIIGRLQYVGDVKAFIQSEDDNRATEWSSGTVEAVWFLPNHPIPTRDYALPVATCFLNLRGKMQTTKSRPQGSFLNLFATCVVIFIERSSFDEYFDSVIKPCTKNTKVIVVVISVKVSGGRQNFRRVLRIGNDLTVIVCEKCSELRIAIELCKEIVKVLKDNKPSKKLDKEGKLLCKELNIAVK